MTFSESLVEEAALEWFSGLGYQVLPGPQIAHDGKNPERTSYRDVLLAERLKRAIVKLNPLAPSEAWEEAFRIVNLPGEASLVRANRAFHKLLVDGVAVETMQNGEPRGELIRLIDFDDPANNDWLAVNQFTVVEGQHDRRPDIVLFVNGIPLAVIELKNLGDAKATITHAWNQLQTYQLHIPSLFRSNALLVTSDGRDSRLGCITTPLERFAAWKTIDGDTVVPSPDLSTLIKGVFEHSRFLDLIRSFIVFEDDGAEIIKKVAQYHQFHAVRKALSTSVRAASKNGDGKGGVLWHTQGSGKSLTMLFFAGKLVRDPRMANPTILMLTDRLDLDDQLFGTFSMGTEILRQAPEQAENRERVRELLNVNAGGVVFSTIQKFFPEKGEERFPVLSDRRNIIVMADEAHRSHYGFDAKVGDSGSFVRGFASHLHDALPNATFVAFTGTPLELADKDTRLVFGDYIDIYDVQRAVRDGATVPIYYESRLIKLDLPEDQAKLVDDEFADITEGQEENQCDQLASKWTQLEAVVGTEKRLAQVAADLEEHIERRQEAISGKVMIVTMSRRIAVELYVQLIAFRPDWAGDGDDTGALKVIMTGAASDPLTWQKHIRNKERRDQLATNFKNPAHPFSIAIVRDMWLTGFDAPSLHTIYIDKPMRGHGLMQAIARVNRVFRDKPGGLVVDYIGIANNLKEALKSYLREDPNTGKPIENETLDIDELIEALLEKLEICRDFFHGFDYSIFLDGSPAERVDTVNKATDFLLYQDVRESGVKQRFLDQATAFSKAFKLASSTDAARAITLEFAFFQAIKGTLTKLGGGGSQRPEDYDLAIRQLVDKAVSPGGVIDIFDTVGATRPDISVLSESFLANVRDMPEKNLAVELLKKLLNDDIRARRKSSVAQSKLFSERLEQSINRYHNRTIETLEIIDELIKLAGEMKDAAARGDKLGLTDDELAFYDALGTNLSAQEVMGDDQLKVIAREVADTVRKNTTIDWTIRETARANLRRYVKRVLRKYGYPPDKQDAAMLLVIEQAEQWAKEAVDPDPIWRG
jgi:type I restriction enzyme R subunit